MNSAFRVPLFVADWEIFVADVQCTHKQPLTSAAANLENAEPWDFSKHPAADLVVINIGTNDQNAYNNVSAQTYQDSLTRLIQGVHGVWPNAQVVLMVSTAQPQPQPQPHTQPA